MDYLHRICAGFYAGIEYMTQLLDTEGTQIPSDDEEGRHLFDADLIDWNDGLGPMLTINVPMYFEAVRGIYDSCGVISAPLKDVLEEYLREFAVFDCGDGIESFCDWLHDYADRPRRLTLEVSGMSGFSRSSARLMGWTAC